MSSRWEPFTEEEKAAVAISFVGNIMAMVNLEFDKDAIVTYCKVIAPMMAELNKHITADEVPRDILDMIAQYEEHRE